MAHYFIHSPSFFLHSPPSILPKLFPHSPSTSSITCFPPSFNPFPLHFFMYSPSILSCIPPIYSHPPLFHVFPLYSFIYSPLHYFMYSPSILSSFTRPSFHPFPLNSFIFLFVSLHFFIHSTLHEFYLNFSLYPPLSFSFTTPLPLPHLSTHSHLYSSLHLLIYESDNKPVYLITFYWKLAVKSWLKLIEIYRQAWIENKLIDFETLFQKKFERFKKYKHRLDQSMSFPSTFGYFVVKII